MSMVLLKAAISTRQSIVTYGRFKTVSFCFHPTLRALMILTSLFYDLERRQLLPRRDNLCGGSYKVKAMAPSFMTWTVS